MKQFTDYILDFASSGIKFIVVMTSFLYGAYKFVIDTLEERESKIKEEIYSVRNSDIKLINVEINNVKGTMENGFKDIKSQNDIILKTLLRSKR